MARLVRLQSSSARAVGVVAVSRGAPVASRDADRWRGPLAEGMTAAGRQGGRIVWGWEQRSSGQVSRTRLAGGSVGAREACPPHVAAHGPWERQLCARVLRQGVERGGSAPRSLLLSGRV